MKQSSIKPGGKGVSLLGFGAMRLPQLSADVTDIDIAQVNEMIQTAYAGGVNYFDTAYVYHGEKSEEVLCRALARYPRESYFLATKLPLWMVNSPEDLPVILERQLKRCQTDYLDYYLMHAMGAERFKKAEQLGVWDFMQRMKQKGRIRNIAFSFHDEPEALEEMCAAHPWDMVQIQLNRFDWEYQSARAQYEILQRRGIPCVVMEPIRGGRLADMGEKGNAILNAVNPGAGIAGWSLRWAAALPGLLTVLSGMSTTAQVRDNLATFENPQPLSEKEDAAFKEAVASFRDSNLIPCTECRYCVPCPNGVDIPGLLALRNQYAFTGPPWAFAEAYNALPAGKNAADCTECGKCAEACPQHLPIVEHLQKMRQAAAR